MSEFLVPSATSNRRSSRRLNRRRRQSQRNKSGDEKTGKKELEKVINNLKQNGYEYNDVMPSDDMTGYYIANFKKSIQYTNVTGEFINDRHIKVSVEFDRDYDYNNIVHREDDSPVYNDEQADEFIQNLWSKTYH